MRCLLAFLVALACALFRSAGGTSYTVGTFTFTVELDGVGAVLRAAVTQSRSGDVLWSSAGPFIAVAGGTFEAKEYLGGFFNVTRVDEGRTTSQTIDAVTDLPRGGLLLAGRLVPSGVGMASTPYTLSITSPLASTLSFDAELSPTVAGEPRCFLGFDSDASEEFYGFGEQYSIVNVKGLKIDIIVSEQGVGRGSEPTTALLDAFSPGSAGSWQTSYAKVPHYLSRSGDGLWRSLFLRTSSYSEFDLRNSERVEVLVMGRALKWSVLDGHEPLDLIRAYTAHVGRMRPLPRWAAGSGAIVGIELPVTDISGNATAFVCEMAARMRAWGIPLAGLWMQDWVGMRNDGNLGVRLVWNWDLDDAHYPGWDAMREELRVHGTRLLTYVNPYLAADIPEIYPNGTRRNIFAEAVERGLLVRNTSGDPYLINSGSLQFGSVDLTSVEARAWFAGIIAENMLLGRVGSSGFMSDFGEYLPWDAVVADGEAAELHNVWPELWSEVSAQAVALARSSTDSTEDEIVFWSRSGYSSSPSKARLFWAGDQIPTFDRFDGMKSAMLGILSAGFSGFALSHSDIGGYTMLNITDPATGKVVLQLNRTSELLARWSEMSAFSDAIFRTHPGTLPKSAAQPWDDELTAKHFAKFARVHGALWPERKRLFGEAETMGWPIARHPMLHFPEDMTARSLDTQFMFGDRLMVRPVFEAGASSVKAYLPEGTWVRVVWGRPQGSEDRVVGPRWVVADAPIGRPAVWVLSRPQLQSGIAVDTLRPFLELAAASG